MFLRLSVQVNYRSLPVFSINAGLIPGPNFPFYADPDSDPDPTPRFRHVGYQNFYA